MTEHHVAVLFWPLVGLFGHFQALNQILGPLQTFTLLSLFRAGNKAFNLEKALTLAVNKLWVTKNDEIGLRVHPVVQQEFLPNQKQADPRSFAFYVLSSFILGEMQNIKS